MDKKPLSYEPYRGAMPYIGRKVIEPSTTWWGIIGNLLGIIVFIASVVIAIWWLSSRPPTEARIYQSVSSIPPCSATYDVKVENNGSVDISSIKVKEINKISFTIDKSQRDPELDYIGNERKISVPLVIVKDNPTKLLDLGVDTQGYYLIFSTGDKASDIARIPIKDNKGIRINPLRANIVIDTLKGDLYFEGIGKVPIPWFNRGLFTGKLPDRMFAGGNPKSAVITNFRIC